MSKVNFNYYSIATSKGCQPLDSVLARLASTALPQRTKTIFTTEMRLEHIHNDNGYWELCFTRVRDRNWPGVSLGHQPSDDLNLVKGSTLTEHTYAVIKPTDGKMLIQYVHSGVRASKIRTFLSDHAGDLNAYTMTPILTRNALQRYNSIRQFTRIEVGIEGVTQADVGYFQGSPVSSAVKESVQSGVQGLTLVFKVDAKDRTQQISLVRARTLINKLLGRPGTVNDLKVSGRTQRDSNVENIDLLEEAKTHSANENAIGWTAGKRLNKARMFIEMKSAIDL